MKKMLAMLLVSSFVLAACQPAAPAATEAATEAVTEAATEAVTEAATEAATEGTTEAAAPAEVGEITSFGMGNSMSLKRSKEAADDKGASAGGNATVVAVGFDAEGKIVDVKFDVIQPALQYAKDGTIEGDAAAEVQSKVEKGDAYGMKAASSIGKEWYEQIGAFEEWMKGKTVEEVTGLKVAQKDDAHPAVPDVPELTSSVTISVEGYQAAVKEAWDNKVDVTGATAVGVGLEATAAKSKALEGDVAQAQFDIPMAAVAIDKDGKVVGAFLDNAQSRVKFDKDGKFAEEPAADAKTKADLGADYGMIKASQIGKEWFEQAEAFAAWAVGKTADEITGLKVVQKDDAHPAVPDVPELTSSVTISVEDYQAVLVEAIENAQAK